MCYNISMDRNLANILGYGVDTFSFENALDYIVQNKGHVITLNPEMIECASTNPEFSKIIHNANLVIPDGIGIQTGLKLLGHNVKRIPGIDFGKELIKRAYSGNKKIALIGATQDVIDNTVKNLRNEFENINIIYWHNGYFDDVNVIYNDLIASSPDLVLVALGSPKQEFFIYNLKSKLPETVFIGLGGSFDVWSGFVKRAPELYQKTGFEWFYRLISDPKRLKRVFPTLPLFILKVIKERLTKK